jgi:hypothetical protein
MFLTKYTGVECPRMSSKDVDVSCCKSVKQAHVR